eukprot:Clim_evm16s240 gene=Clim_evmTU16s240
MVSSLQPENTFHFMRSGLPVHENKDNATLLEKWNLNVSLRAYKFCSDRHVEACREEKVLRDLLCSNAFISAFSVLAASGTWAKVGAQPLGEHAKIKPILSSYTTMGLLIRVANADNGICRGEGYIRKQLEEIVYDISVSDKLRAMLVQEESDDFMLYNEKSVTSSCFGSSKPTLCPVR